MKKEETKPMSQVLFEGESDLFDILVNSGISCWTCYKNKKHRGWNEGGFNCENGFASAPEISVCLKWREGLNEVQRRRFSADGKWKEYDFIDRKGEMKCD